MSDAQTLRRAGNGLVASNWPRSAGAAEKPARLTGRRYLLVSWLTLIGLVIPAWEAEIKVGGAKFTAGRLAVTILAIPALVVLFRRGRHLVAADIAAIFMATWMLYAAVATGGFGSLASPAGESLQFLFAYFVGRAFYSSPAALDTFIRMLTALTFLMVAEAAAEHVTGRWLAHDAAAAIFGGTPLSPTFRGSSIRATATLDHPILFGVFCALVNAMLLLWEESRGRRIMLSVLCLTGCVLSQSSAALIAYALGVAAYAYDRLMRNIGARWTTFWILVCAGMSLIFLIAEHPIGWVLSHLTLDPQSGYYRILIWDAALERIGERPIVGYAFQLFHENILDATVDSVWLVEALRYGIPAIVFLLWANIAAVWPTRRRGLDTDNDFQQRMSFAFTIVLLLFVFSGITVHFWNYIWIFWGLCIGIKASLRERAVTSASSAPWSEVSESRAASSKLEWRRRHGV